MMTNHEKFRMIDVNKEKDWFMEVNWDPKDKKTNECQIIRITHPDGSESLIKREHLNAVLFAIGRADEQREMVPQRNVLTRWYETVVSVKAKKDIYKGELITFPIKLSLPPITQDVIGSGKKN